ncbi:hypothetical protein ABC382_00765 [Lysinibacillus sp. 1P01SD]|uniref:hypothetical protein n=1 Tax=Lysinibacillus sp. 1P01SD TaxID=3132285 RepID=UPI0039A1C8DA
MPKQMNIFDDFESLIYHSTNENRCIVHIKDNIDDSHDNNGIMPSFPAPLEKSISIHDQVRLRIIECNPDSVFYDDYIYLEGNYKKLDGQTGEIINISITKNGTKLYEVLFNEKNIVIELYEREFVVIG